MTESYTLIKGTVPLLISMPHNGQQIPDDIALTMTESAKRVADTDWYQDRLYDFAQLLGAYIIIPKYIFFSYQFHLNPHPIHESLTLNFSSLLTSSFVICRNLCLDGLCLYHFPLNI